MQRSHLHAWACLVREGKGEAAAAVEKIGRSTFGSDAFGEAMACAVSVRTNITE